MNRSQIVKDLIKEGFSSSTLVSFSDKQILSLAHRILSEQQVKGAVIMNKATSPQDVKKITDGGTNVELREKDSECCPKCRKKVCICKKKDFELKKKKEHLSLKDQMNKKNKVKKDEDIPKSYGTSPKHQVSTEDLSQKKKTEQKKRVDYTIGKLKEHNQAQKFVNSLVENKYHSLTTKNEIMNMIKTKLNEQETMSPMPASKPKKGHNGVPEFMTYDSIKKSGGPSVAPSKPKVVPGTKPTSPSKPKKTPFNPGTKIDPKPKAMKENSPSVAPSKPKVAPGTKPTSPSKPKKTPFNPGTKIDPKPKAIK